MAPKYVVELEVAGRRSGLPRKSLLVQVDDGGRRYLVSLAGESEWVRNVRAAAGHVLLTDDRERYLAHLTEVPVAQRARVIHAYVHRPSPRGRVVARESEARHYFGIDPEAPLERIAEIAGHYPVFRVDRRGPTDAEETAPHPPRILRASPTDRAMLAMGGRDVPEQIGVLLLFRSAPSLDLERLRTVLEVRTRSVPRLRRRLVQAPAGCGGPIWVDDPRFDIARHVRASPVSGDATDRELCEAALDIVMAPLPWGAPLWAAVLLTGLPAGRAGVVIVLHHVLIDGLGGLALLGALLDPGVPVEPQNAAPMPSRRALAVDAWTARCRALRGARRGWLEVRRSMAAGGGWRPPPAAPCSLLRRTGPRRRAALVVTDLAAIRSAAHRHGATTNDAVLVAVGAALSTVLAARGESVDPLRVRPGGCGRRGRP